DTTFNSLTYIIPILVAVTFLTLIEQKILSYVQAQKGPNIFGPFRLLQPIADGIKLFIKEAIRSSTSSPLLFITTPPLAHTPLLPPHTPPPAPGGMGRRIERI
uniref:NADH-ubiquinone oxidoreductase chain 1 n=1 Tax=Amazona collaria TaxID=241587 RepID=A0A8B9FA53_9PSIT